MTLFALVSTRLDFARSPIWTLTIAISVLSSSSFLLANASYQTFLSDERLTTVEMPERLPIPDRLRSLARVLDDGGRRSTRFVGGRNWEFGMSMNKKYRGKSQEGAPKDIPYRSLISVPYWCAKDSSIDSRRLVRGAGCDWKTGKRSILAKNPEDKAPYAGFTCQIWQALRTAAVFNKRYLRERKFSGSEYKHSLQWTANIPTSCLVRISKEDQVA